MAPDTISAHDVSVKILHRFRPEHSCPHHNLKKGALCAVLLLGSLAHLVFGCAAHISTRFCSRRGVSVSIASSRCVSENCDLFVRRVQDQDVVSYSLDETQAAKIQLEVS